MRNVRNERYAYVNMNIKQTRTDSTQATIKEK